MLTRPSAARFVLAILFVAAPSLAQFSQQGLKLVVADAAGSPLQGISVSISSDGNTAIVGGFRDNNNMGAAWIWMRSRGVWQEGPKLVSADAAGINGQGWSVALSGDGNTAIVGAFDTDKAREGAAWIWARHGGVWTEEAKLVGSGAIGNANQGFSVSISADGNTAIVGAPKDGVAGSAWIWTRSAGVWSQQGAKLIGSGAEGNANQGQSVSLSADGNTAIIGGPSDSNAAGAVWVWTRSEGVWTQQGAKLTGSGAAGNSVGAFQGISTSLSSDGNTAIAGGYFDNSDQSGNSAAGAAWIWTRKGGVWSQQGTKLIGSGAVGNAEQGVSVSLSADGNTAAVGGLADNGNTGATWFWTRRGEVWTQQGTKLVGSVAVGAAYQGRSVSLSGDARTAISGGSGDNNSVGAAWVFASDENILVPQRKHAVRH
jgi:hypothetical protein